MYNCDDKKGLVDPDAINQLVNLYLNQDNSDRVKFSYLHVGQDNL